MTNQLYICLKLKSAAPLVNGSRGVRPRLPSLRRNAIDNNINESLSTVIHKFVLVCIPYM